MIQTNILYEVDYARPMCLNKEANDPVTIDEIRPIFIVGILIKIIEYRILQQLKKVKLSIKQFGFRERLSTQSISLE